MKKFLLLSFMFTALIAMQANMADAHQAYVKAHKPYVRAHVGYTARPVVVHTQRPPVHRHVRPVCRSSSVVISSGVNYISRDIGTGVVTQVVQVAPPPAYVSGCYYY